MPLKQKGLGREYGERVPVWGLQNGGIWAFVHSVIHRPGTGVTDGRQGRIGSPGRVAGAAGMVEPADGKALRRDGGNGSRQGPFWQGGFWGDIC